MIAHNYRSYRSICTSIAIIGLVATVPANAELDTDAMIESAGESAAANNAYRISRNQDELAADVQELIDEQANEKIIGMLEELEGFMGEATDRLESDITDGDTLAIQTQIIEKIFEAAKEKNKQNQQGEGEGEGQEGEGEGQQGQGQGQGGQSDQGGMDSMLQMMQNMMDGGSDIGETQKEGGKGGKGEKPGQGGGGESEGDAQGPANDADNELNPSERTVPKNSGKSGQSVPREFRQAMDAFNKGATKQIQP
ncbi:hypothetical protein [Persicirhabdus sediminis]|uniref:Uncharacterized protein n=1 Tax=Persicirhabdus sediminis TaxID=454144 RepID=A0A8J7SGX3_9BACT|nr:hypothetical protein [Persicirhabdus sediminis]MBK1790410.1 hypothetical protein [Persicirhabdus sediminis]